MRVAKYLIERNIGLESLNHVCDYLHFNNVNINTKLNDNMITIFDITLNAEQFYKWLDLKHNFEKIEIVNAKNLVENLSYKHNIEIDEVSGERIINALYMLINKSFFTREKNKLLQIIQSDKSVFEKILTLKQTEPFVNPKENISKVRNKTLQRNNNQYDNFHWGGLSGEEAYIGYWNTE